MVPVGPTLPVKLTQPKIDLLAALLEELEPADLPALRACLDAQFVCDAEVAREPIMGSAAFTRASGNIPRRAPLPLTVQQAMALAGGQDSEVRLTLDCGGETIHHRCRVVRLCEDGAWHVKPAMPDPHGFYRVRTGPALGMLPLVTSCEPAPAVAPGPTVDEQVMRAIESGELVVLTLSDKGATTIHTCVLTRAWAGNGCVVVDPPLRTSETRGGWYNVVSTYTSDFPRIIDCTPAKPAESRPQGKLTIAGVNFPCTPEAAAKEHEAMTGERVQLRDLGLHVSLDRVDEVGPCAAVDEAIDLFKRTNSRGPTPASDGWKTKWAAMGSRITAGDPPENTIDPAAASADPVWMVATIPDLKQRLARGEWPLVRAIMAQSHIRPAVVQGRLVSIEDPNMRCHVHMGTVMSEDGRDQSPIDMEARSLEVWTVLADDLPLPPANEAAKRSHDVTRRVVESQLAEIIGILEADGRDGTVDVFTFLRQRLQERRVMVEELREAREPLTFHTAWGRAKERSDYRKEFWNRCHSSRGAEVHSLPEWLAIVYQGIEVASGPVEPTGRDISTALGNTVVLARDVAERLQDGLTCETSKQRAAALLAALDRFEARTDAMYDQPHARNAEAAAQVPTP
jgi:hypothetical protein